MPRRPAAHHHRIMAQAHRVHGPAGIRPRDPLAFARAGGDAAIKAGGEFEGDQWASGHDTGQKSTQIVIGNFGQDAALYHDTRCAQHVSAFAINARVGVRDGHDHPFDARVDQRLCAGRCLPVVGAGFQRDIGRGPACCRSRPRQCFGFGMRASARLGPAAPDDPTPGHDHAAHGGVGPCGPLSAPPQCQRQRHVSAVGVRGHSSGWPSGRSS